MEKEKSPRRLAAGSVGSGNTSRSNVIAFPVTVATCECCGGHFQRRRCESWKRLCLNCWRWNKVGQALSMASQLLREGE